MDMKFEIDFSDFSRSARENAARVLFETYQSFRVKYCRTHNKDNCGVILIKKQETVLAADFGSAEEKINLLWQYIISEIASVNADLRITIYAYIAKMITDKSKRLTCDSESELTWDDDTDTSENSPESILEEVEQQVFDEFVKARALYEQGNELNNCGLIIFKDNNTYQSVGFGLTISIVIMITEVIIGLILDLHPSEWESAYANIVNHCVVSAFEAKKEINDQKTKN